MDKVRCKAVVEAQGIRVAGHLALDRPTWAISVETVRQSVTEDLGFPCVVKPSAQGSSFGVTIVQDIEGFDAAMNAAFDVGEYVMVEEYVPGRELTCAVLDADPQERLRPLPVTEIRPKSGSFFDFEAKYTAGACEEITPADLDPEVAEQVAEMAAHVHEIVGCVGWSRSDFILGPEGPVWIEVNTIPGLTPTSLFPQAAAVEGISYGALAGMLVDDALRRAPIREGNV
jgi:D-alanine-D-alanine ligase